MRRPIVAGNWKMNTTLPEAIALSGAIAVGVAAHRSVDRVICPPFISIAAVAERVRGSGLHVGAQDLHWESKGAFTGEVSAGMLSDLCQYVIVGHSERRQYFGETDATVNRKIRAAIAVGLIPIVCVGENLAQYDAGQTASIVATQVRGALDSIAPTANLVIAYEPIWAIGTGRAATALGANDVIREMRRVVAATWSRESADAMRIQYGGSVTAANARDLFSQSDIDGALVGGASLKAEDFAQIVAAAARV